MSSEPCYSSLLPEPHLGPLSPTWALRLLAALLHRKVTYQKEQSGRGGSESSFLPQLDLAKAFTEPCVHSFVHLPDTHLSASCVPGLGPGGGRRAMSKQLKKTESERFPRHTVVWGLEVTTELP